MGGLEGGEGAIAAGGGDAERHDDEGRPDPDRERHTEEESHGPLIGTGGAGLKPGPPRGRTTEQLGAAGYIPRRLSMYGTVRSRIFTSFQNDQFAT